MGRASPRYYITLCAIVKKEDKYAEEWVLFHLAAGVDHFLFIENNNSSTLPITLEKYISAGIVEVMLYPGNKKPQREAYNRAIRYLEQSSRWIGFFDVDEFVFPTREEDLPSVLADYEKFAGLAVNWVAFGSGGHADAPSGWVTQNFLDRGELDHEVRHENYLLPGSGTKTPRYRPMNTHVKCFVDPSRTEFFRTAHHYRFSPGEFAVTEKGSRIDGPFSDTVSVDRIRCNHYWSKSIAELEEKLSKGRVSQVSNTGTNGYDRGFAFAREKASSGVKDVSAVRFSKKAKNLKIDADRVPNQRIVTPRTLRYSPVHWLISKQRSLLLQIRKKRRTGIFR
jgi:hypothetical protein